METWTAAQIGQSNGAYSGRRVRLIVADIGLVDGILVRSDAANGTPGQAAVQIENELHFVPDATLIEVL
jgi:hypothetical protein